MAIYHFSAQVASRSAGRSAIAMAAYRSGERLTDERTGELKHYKREAKPETVILAPAQSPEWVQDRNRLWNEVEKAEKRKDAQLCREINLALPKEFNPKLQEQLLHFYCEREFVAKGMVADLAIHRDDSNNPHAHIMLTMREMTPKGFGQKVRAWNDRELLENWREAWANDINRIFERADRPERVDHRSLEKQGVTDRLPTIHEGPTVREMESRGVATDRGSINREVQEHNRMVVDLRAYAEEKTRLQAELAKPARTTVQVESDYNRLYWERHKAKTEISMLEGFLDGFRKVEELKKEREQLRDKQDQLQPKNAWQRMTKNNQPQIDALERDLYLKDKQIESEQKKLPPKEPNQLQQQISVVRGAFSAIDHAFKAVERERDKLQRQKQQRMMREAQQSQDHERDHER
ncbi:MobQ family relaxase [Paenibacillus glycinis]|uniref:MobA/MobL family protein n=1 Tax=Paenibacillus glycinis TaxID=2697035 RepID=A0ABW9Y1P4_9BACL|nr:MobQ family relaxase [Paenibacillus glycinis]NBD28376.1 MobA/MobL family protein [Paenibacillus glycinis]